MCTGIRFTDDKGNLYFGRNLDWTFSYGESVVITQRGFSNPKFMDGKVETKHALIGMAVVAEGLPMYLDCGNEAGLAIAGLNFPGYAEYEDAPVEGKVNVAAYAFPTYVASQFATVDEAEAALANVAIVGESINDHYEVSLLHWLISDKDRAIVVEYTQDGMHVYHDDLDVLTNQPTFPYHHENVRSYLHCTPDYPSQPIVWGEDQLEPYGSGSGMRGIPGDFYSPSRFVRAAYLNAHYPQQQGEAANVSRLFHTLLGVSMVKGGAKVADGDFEYTLYTGGYSAATQTYYYSTYEDLAVKSFRLQDAGLEGGQVVSCQ